MKSLIYALLAFAAALWVSVFLKRNAPSVWELESWGRNVNVLSIGDNVGVTALGAAQITIPLFNPTEESPDGVNLILRSPGGPTNITTSFISGLPAFRVQEQSKDGGTTWILGIRRDLKVVSDELGRLRSISFRNEWVALIWSEATLRAVRRSRHPEIRLFYAAGLVCLVEDGSKNQLTITYEEQNVPSVVRAAIADCPIFTVSEIAGYKLSSHWNSEGFTIACRDKDHRVLSTTYNPRNANIKRLLETKTTNRD